MKNKKYIRHLVLTFPHIVFALLPSEIRIENVLVNVDDR